MHNHRRELGSESWREVKGRLVVLFGGVAPVATRLGVHRNSIKLAVEGRCPGVRKRLYRLLASAKTKSTK